MWPFGKKASTGVRKTAIEWVGELTRLLADGGVAVDQVIKIFHQVDETLGGKLTEQLSALGGSKFEDVRKRLFHALNEMRFKNLDGCQSIEALIRRARERKLGSFTEKAVILTLATMSKSDESLENDLGLFARMTPKEQESQLNLLWKENWLPKTGRALKGLAQSAGEHLGELSRAFGEALGELAESDREDGDRLREPGGWLEQTRREKEDARRRADERVTEARRRIGR